MYTFIAITLDLSGSVMNQALTVLIMLRSTRRGCMCSIGREKVRTMHQERKLEGLGGDVYTRSYIMYGYLCGPRYEQVTWSQAYRQYRRREYPTLLKNSSGETNRNSSTGSRRMPSTSTTAGPCLSRLSWATPAQISRFSLQYVGFRTTGSESAPGESRSKRQEETSRSTTPR